MRENDIVLGGQAVIEGVMMKGGDEYAVAVRKPSGEIVAEVFPIRKKSVTEMLSRVFILRGVVILCTMLSVGIRSLSYSAQVALEEEEEEAPSWVLPVTLAFAVVMGIGIFFLIPYGLGVLFSRVTGAPVGGVSFNAFEGVIRVGMFLLYLWLITLMPDVRRVFMYHGAEHKVVNAWESGAPVTIDEVMRHSRFHPRCGTSFIFLVLVVSILVFSLIPAHFSVVEKGVLRIAMLPVVAGISYEIIRVGGKKRKSVLFRGLSMPGIFCQRFTTYEPSPDQVKVAIVSFSKLSERGGL